MDSRKCSVQLIGTKLDRGKIMKNIKEYSIIQIIPAPTDMKSVYSSVPDIYAKVICLALVEPKDTPGERLIKAVDSMDDGELIFAEDVENFKGFIFSDLSIEELEELDEEKL